MEKKTMKDWGQESQRAYERTFPRPELSALTTTLAQMCSEHTARHKSLKMLCIEYMAFNIDHAPKNLAAYDKALWCLGFDDAMHRVLAYIESGEPAPRSPSR